MIKATKQRVMITIDKDLLKLCKDAAVVWEITLSEYFAHLAYLDITAGFTAQVVGIVNAHTHEKE